MQTKTNKIYFVGALNIFTNKIGIIRVLGVKKMIFPRLSLLCFRPHPIVLETQRTRSTNYK